MLNIIEKESVGFYTQKFNNIGFSIEKPQNDLSNKLHQFRSDRHKLVFFRIRRHKIVTEMGAHISKCTNPNYQKEDNDRTRGLLIRLILLALVKQ